MSVAVVETLAGTLIFDGMEPRKKFYVSSHRQQMAIKPNPDNVPSMMQEDFGTKVLITDVAADRLLEKAVRENPNQKKFTEFCGGVGGWDDFCERMGE